MKPNKSKQESTEEVEHGNSSTDRPTKKGSRRGNRNRGFTPSKTKCGKQDYGWYGKFPTLAENAGRIAWNHRAGTDIKVLETSMNLDMVMGIPFIPTPGVSESIKSAINVMSSATWKVLNRRYRGIGGYQQSDIGVSQFALMDAFGQIAEAERAYGLVLKYTLFNENLPEAMLEAIGLDPTGFPDLPEFRQQLNKIILKAKTLCLIKGFSALDRRLFLSTNVFKDSKSARSGLFAYHTPGWWKWTPTEYMTGSAVCYMQKRATGEHSSVLETDLRTQYDIIHDLDAQFNALLDDDDIDRICSDILAYFGNEQAEANVVFLGLLPEDFIVEPIYSEEAVLQLHNTVFGLNLYPVDYYTNTDDYYFAGLSSRMKKTTLVEGRSPRLSVFQEDNVIKFNMCQCDPSNVDQIDTGTMVALGSDEVTSYVYGSNFGHIIDTWMENPDYQHIIEISRQINLRSARKESNLYYAMLTSHGTEVFGNPVIAAGQHGHIYSVSMDNPSIEWDNGNDSFITKFDWAPLCYSTNYDSATADPAEILSIIGDLDNYRVLEITDLDEMNDVCVLSEYHNPLMSVILDTK